MAVLDEAHWQHADVAAGRADGPAGDFYKGTRTVFRVRNSDRFVTAQNVIRRSNVAVSKSLSLTRGTEGSNPSLSSGESAANPLRRSQSLGASPRENRWRSSA